MELKQYLTIFKKHWLFILVFALSGATVAYLFSAKLPSGYQQDQLFFISSSQTESEGYTFEGYYGQEKARNFTDTAIAILESPEFLIETSIPDAKISAHKLTPQLVRITVTSTNPEAAAGLMPEIASNFNQKIRDLTESDQTILSDKTSLLSDKTSLQITAVGPGSPTYYVAPSKKIYIPFGFAIGLTFAGFVIALKTYFKL